MIICEHIDAAAVINAILIRPIPGTCIKAGHARHDSFGHICNCAQPTAIIVDGDPISIGNTAMAGVLGVYPEGIIAFIFNN